MNDIENAQRMTQQESVRLWNSLRWVTYLQDKCVTQSLRTTPFFENEKKQPKLQLERCKIYAQGLCD